VRLFDCHKIVQHGAGLYLAPTIIDQETTTTTTTRIVHVSGGSRTCQREGADHGKDHGGGIGVGGAKPPETESFLSMFIQKVAESKRFK